MHQPIALITGGSRGIGAATAVQADVAAEAQVLAMFDKIDAKLGPLSSLVNNAGVVDTDIHASGGQPDRARQLAPQVPMQRAGTAREVAQAIVWLMGNESGYSTGSFVDVTGGR